MGVKMTSKENIKMTSKVGEWSLPDFTAYYNKPMKHCSIPKDKLPKHKLPNLRQKASKMTHFKSYIRANMITVSTNKIFKTNKSYC